MNSKHTHDREIMNYEPGNYEGDGFGEAIWNGGIFASC